MLVPPKLQHDFYTCEATTLKDVEGRIAKAGYPLLTVTETSITTGPLTTELDGREVVKYADRHLVSSARGSYTSRFIVAKQGDEITFSIFLEGRKVDPIVREQLENAVTKRELNRLREIVCGSSFL